jgi:hypothetical protein
MKLPIVHIWGQDSFHDDVFIAGNLAGLKRLRDAIVRALEIRPITATAAVSVNDGEHYEIRVCVYFEDGANKLAVPYTEDFAQEKNEAAIRPWVK